MELLTAIKNPIGAIGVTNTTSLLIYTIKYGIVDKVLAGFDTDANLPEWYTLHNDGDSPYFYVGKAVFHISDAVKIAA